MTKENARKTERGFRVLQDSYALAMHIWEDGTTSEGRMPEVFDVIRGTNAQTIAEAPKVSMSLLPAQHTNMAISPWDFKSPAYLFDMTQERPDAARVLRVFHEDMNSGNDPHDKSLRLGMDVGDARIDGLYRNKSSNADIYQELSEHPDFSLRQLAALGRYYENFQGIVPPFLFDINLGKANPHIIKLNEVVAVVGQEHIAAIAIPVLSQPEVIERGKLEGGRVNAIHDPYDLELTKLYGAINGLAHIEKGMDVPVVFYHVDGENLGKCEFIGQGKKELTDIALKAIRTLQETPQPSDDRGYAVLFRDFKEPVQRLLGGVDIDIALDEQKTKLLELRRSSQAREIP